ncbi:MAG: dTDP-4-dehydrorhamnose reductase [Sphingomonadales bacterium]
MKAVVLGAAGQVGTALRATAPAGASVIGLTRAELDIADLDQVVRILTQHAPDVVINAAAYTAVDKAEAEQDAAFLINAVGVGNVAEAAVRVGAKLVHISTDFVFDGRSSTPYTPDAPIAPLGVYGASKAEGEKRVRALAPDALIVRTAWVYAADSANFVATMLRLMATGNSVRVVADQVGTPTHATSLAHALWAMVAANASGTHHYTDAGVASWYDLAVATGELAHQHGRLPAHPEIVPIRTVDYPTPAARPAYSVLDKTSAWAIPGVASRHWRDELDSMFLELKAKD